MTIVAEVTDLVSNGGILTRSVSPGGDHLEKVKLVNGQFWLGVAAELDSGTGGELFVRRWLM